MVIFQGIKDAMPHPEVLEGLEKGEMKFEVTSGGSSCSEDEEEEDSEAASATSNDASTTTTTEVQSIKVSFDFSPNLNWTESLRCFQFFERSNKTIHSKLKNSDTHR